MDRQSNGMSVPRDTPFPAHLKQQVLPRHEPARSLRPMHHSTSSSAASVASWHSGAAVQHNDATPEAASFAGLSMACNSIACHSTPPRDPTLEPQHDNMDDTEVSPLTGHGGSPPQSHPPNTTAVAVPVSAPVTIATALGTKRALDDPFVSEEGSCAPSCVLDPIARTLRAPPRRETDTNFIRPATAAPASNPASVGVARDEASLVCLTAEVEFEGKEIQQLVAAMVQRQQGQLRELFDELAANQVAYSDEAKELRAALAEQLQQVHDDWHNDRQRWEQERARWEEAEGPKRRLVECLQSELQHKNDALRVLTDQLTIAQSRLETANAQISELTQTLDALRRERRPPSSQRGLTPTPVNAVPLAKASLAPLPKQYHIVLSGFRGDEKTELERGIQRLGGHVVHCPPDQLLPSTVTHVVCASFTTKVFAGLLKTGTHVCPADFVRKSVAQGSWINEASVRSLVGDAVSWRDAYPKVLVPPAQERDGGTSELCSVLQQSGIQLVTTAELTPFQAAMAAPLINFINEIKPAFLS